MGPPFATPQKHWKSQNSHGDDWALLGARATRGVALVHRRGPDREVGFELLRKIRERAVSGRFALLALPFVDIYLAREKARLGDIDGAMAWCPTPAVLDTMSVRPADPTPAACGSWPLRRSAGCPTVGTPPIDLGCWLTSSTCCATLKMSPDRRSRRASQRPFLVADSGRRSSGVKVGSPRYAAGTPP